MEKAEIEHLAKLARIKVSQDEVDDLREKIDAVLDYVSVVNDITAETGMTKKIGPVHNVFRQDEVTNEPGEYTEDILSQAPEREGDYLKVKKILNTED